MRWDEKPIKGALSLFCIDHLLQGIGPSWSMVNIPIAIYFLPLQVDVSADNFLDRCRNSHSSHPLTPLSAETQSTWTCAGTVSDFHIFCEFICTPYLLCLEMFPWSHSSFLVLTVFHLLLWTLRGGVWYIPFSTECYTISYSLYIIKLWISVYFHPLQEETSLMMISTDLWII